MAAALHHYTINQLGTTLTKQKKHHHEYEINHHPPPKAWYNSDGHRPWLIHQGGNIENALGCSGHGCCGNGRRSCWYASQIPYDEKGGICDGTSRFNSHCERDCGGIGPCPQMDKVVCPYPRCNLCLTG